MNELARKESLVPSYKELYRRLEADNIVEERREWLITKLQNMTPEVEGEFLYWWHTGRTLDEVEIKDLTVGWILENQSYYPLHVFIDFDFLYRDPEDRYMYRYLRWGRSKFFYVQTKK